ncbi:tetratricopeptide repeat protein [Streptomyces zhihengii]|uniref:Tetratricopeptide repeat protein n=2 Tax=Streptomyces zhihengii TaxID=1818004 RepID=A0ABS2V2M4_9ACTN|nr:tetratricopeptide repeat protein [Streptomyces zhihengii]
MDEPVFGELVPLDHDAVSQASGLQPLAEDIVGERRDLAVALRQCFVELKVSVRRYAVLRRYSASSVSRYLSGETVAPDHFIAVLIDDVGKELGRPLSSEVRSRLTDMQRAALKATNSRAWRVQQLEDQLAGALQEKAIARTQADAVASRLLEYQERVAVLEAERQQLAHEVSHHRAADIELDLLRVEQRRMLTSHDALLQRVSELEAALEAAEQRVALAEQRCADLEHTLLAADAAAAVEEQLDSQRTERKLAESLAELRTAQAEVARLRARDQPGPGGTASGSGPGTVVELRTREPLSRVSVVYPGYHQPWAAWIAACLEGHGHRARMQRWEPGRAALEDYFRDLLLTRGQIVLIVSDRLLASETRPAGEWSRALRGIVAANADRILAVSLSDTPLLRAGGSLEPVPIWGIGAEEAAARLLSRLDHQVRRASARPIPPRAEVRFPNTAPTIWGSVPRRNPRFSGRDDLLDMLQRRLTGAEPANAICALLGMSGIGKTQIAIEYSHRFGSDYDLVWWVDSDDRDTQSDRLAELAAELGVSSRGAYGDRTRAVREALRRGDPYSRWLIIFDGWDDIDDAAGMLPQGPGHVLITSRNRSWGNHTEVLEVPSFDRAESISYLMRRAPHLSQREADQVAAEVSDVPLPLGQAGSWLGESGMDVREYLRRIRDGGLSTADESSREGTSQSSLTSWSILIGRLRDTSPQALAVLSLCVAFAPGDIPLGIVRDSAPADLPEDLRWIATDQAAWTRALDTLVNYSVLNRPRANDAEPGPGWEMVYMHRLVHDIAARLTSSEHREAHRQAVRTLLAKADPGNPMESRHWPRYAALLPHLEPSGALTSRHPTMQSAVLNCLRYCDASGRYEAGIDLAARTRAHWSTSMSPADEPMLSVILQEGAVLRAAGHFQAAYDGDRLALTELKSKEPRNLLGELTASSAIAVNLRHHGRYEESYHLQQSVLNGLIDISGPDTPATLTVRYEQGITLRMLGQFRDAYEQDVANQKLQNRILGDNHPATLASATAIARSQRLLGRYNEALTQQQAVARRYLSIFGKDHPRCLEADIELALCQLHSGRLQGMADSLAAVLTRATDTHGTQHPTTLLCMTVYGNHLREHGDRERAGKLLAEAEAGYRTLLGPAHPIAHGVTANTALLMQRMHEPDNALAMLERALVGMTSFLGSNHPWVLGCALNTAASLSTNGQHTEASALSRRTHRQARETLGDEHPLSLACQVALACDLRSTGETEEAGHLEKAALHLLTDTLGAQHPQTESAHRRKRPHADFEPSIS